MSTILLRCLNAVWLVVAASLVSGQTLKDPALRVTEVVAGLNTPTTMAFIGPSDILVLQKNDGLVQHVIDGVLQPVPVLDVAVDSASERGLLGIAIHPAFPATPFVYLYLID
jgi:aldose sugar dehydrogenase